MPEMNAGSTDPREESLPVIDLAVFRGLASMLGSARILRMTVSFFADAEQRLDLLDGAETSPQDLQEHAHALVSMSGHFGLKRLSGLCMTLQERARQNGGLEGRPMLRAAVAEARCAIDRAVASGAGLVADGRTIDGRLAQPAGSRMAEHLSGRAAAPRPGSQGAVAPELPV